MEQKNIVKTINLIKEEVKKYNNSLMTNVSNSSKDPFKVLISCILSLRTRDETTDVITEKLFNKIKTPKQLANLNIKKLQEIIKPVNYYKTKAKTIKGISQLLYTKYNSKVPNNREELQKLKGIGPKTSAIVLTYGFSSKMEIPTDVHVHRLPNRLGWITTKTPEETESKLKKIIPNEYWQDINDSFVTFGKNICTPISPFCSTCVIKNYCKQVNIRSKR